MRKVNVAEAKAQLSRLIDAVLEGEEVIISRRNVPMVKLSPVSRPKAKTRLGGLEGRGWISPTFDEPLEDFEPYTR